MRRWRRSTWTGASAATRHYVERTLLSYRLAGVDKDQATRDRLQALHEKATRLSLEFSRNIQEGGEDDCGRRRRNWRGCRRITSRGIRPDASGQITLTTDQPDMQPVMTFASSAGSAGADVSGLQHARVSGQQADPAGSAGDAAGDCRACLGFAAGPTWRLPTR